MIITYTFSAFVEPEGASVMSYVEPVKYSPHIFTPFPFHLFLYYSTLNISLPSGHFL